MTPLLDRVRAGERLDDVPIVDCHGHMGPWFNFHVPRGDAAGMVATMDMVGINACVASHHAGIGPDFVLGNDEVQAGAEAFPGRLFGYIAVNPNYPADEMRAELEKRWATGRFVGVKLHPDVHRYPADGPNYAPAWEFAHERGAPLLSHYGQGSRFNSARQFDAPAERYSQAKVLLAHAISGLETLEAAAELTLRRPNVYMDITGSPLIYGALELAVERVGAGRVLFGTDLPFIDPRPQVGRVAFAQIAEADKLRILGENAVEVFGLEGRMPRDSSGE